MGVQLQRPTKLLDRNEAPQSRIIRKPNVSHRAPAEKAPSLVSIGKKLIHAGSPKFLLSAETALPYWFREA